MKKSRKSSFILLAMSLRKRIYREKSLIYTGVKRLIALVTSATLITGGAFLTGQQTMILNAHACYINNFPNFTHSLIYLTRH